VLELGGHGENNSAGLVEVFDDGAQIVVGEALAAEFLAALEDARNSKLKSTRLRRITPIPL
jgi:hypothetical protein